MSISRRVLLLFVLAFISTTGIAQPSSAPEPGALSPTYLIARIDEGENANFLKYKFLGRFTPRGTDRETVIAQVREALGSEKDACRLLLMKSALAYGLASSNILGDRQEAARIYVELLKAQDWPAGSEKHRARVTADFLRADKALATNAEGRAIAAEMLKDYLEGKGDPNDGPAFATLAAAEFDRSGPISDLIKKMIEERAQDMEFWTRLGEMYLVQRRDEAMECFEKAWALEPKEDAQIKRIGHGLADAHLLNSKYAMALEAEKNVIERLKVKDDYLKLAELHHPNRDDEAMKEAIGLQLQAAPGLRTNIDAAWLYMQRKMPDEALELLKEAPKDLTRARDADEEALTFAAAVVRLSCGKLKGAETDEEVLSVIRDNRERFLELAREREWLMRFFHQGIVLQRTLSKKDLQRQDAQ